MATTLSISSPELNDAHIQKLTADLSRIIGKETDIEAELAERISEKGFKGDPITLGLISLTFISSGSVVALFGIIKSFLEREKSIQVTIKRENGTEITIDAKNFGPHQIKEILEYWND